MQKERIAKSNSRGANGHYKLLESESGACQSGESFDHHHLKCALLDQVVEFLNHKPAGDTLAKF